MIRTAAERVAEMESKLAAEKQKLAVKKLKEAVKSGYVSDENKKEYRSKLRDFKAIEKAPTVMFNLGYTEAAELIEKEANTMVEELKSMIDSTSETEPETRVEVKSDLAETADDEEEFDDDEFADD